jgi:hypothetical protein
MLIVREIDQADGLVTEHPQEAFRSAAVLDSKTDLSRLQ